MQNQTPPQQQNPAQVKANSARIAHDVLRSLSEDAIDLTAMRALLENERQVLEQRDHSQLEEITHKKSALAAQLEQRNTKRLAGLARLIPTPITASPTDAKSWRDAMQHLEQSSGLAMIGTWDKVEQQLRECSELLKKKKKIIGNMRQGVNQFLNLLRGQTASGQTYGATGKAEVFADNPTITSA